MQSASLCTVRQRWKHFSRACTLAVFWRYQSSLFFPWRNFGLLEEDIFSELFSILRHMHKTCNESVYKQLHESNVRKWVLLMATYSSLRGPHTVNHSLWYHTPASCDKMLFWVESFRTKWSKSSFKLRVGCSYFFICVDFISWDSLNVILKVSGWGSQILAALTTPSESHLHWNLQITASRALNSAVNIICSLLAFWSHPIYKIHLSSLKS